MKLAIVGGHLSPALAVIEELPKDTDIIYIGRKHALEGDSTYSLEYQKISSLNIPFIDLKTGRLQRTLTKHTLTSLIKLPIGFFQALNMLSRYNPDAVICFGGYVQIPVGLAAFLLRIPIVIHEQTTKAGLANKILSPMANTICISWQKSSKYFPPHKTILTGIPIQKAFLMPPQSIKTKKHPTIYITGGSLGSHAINLLVQGCLEKLLHKFYIIHQTGDAKEYADFEHLQKIKQDLPPHLRGNYEPVKFIKTEDAARIMNGADLVISRSGMNTIAELLYLGKPCILIPLPHGQTNEQLENALFIQKVGLGKVLIQKELTSEILYSQIVEFTAKLDYINESTALVAKKLIKHDSAEKIIKIVWKACSQKN